MSRPSIVILGAGGVGGYFGARLVENAAADVTFLVRTARKDRLSSNGLSVKSPHGNIDALAVRAATSAELEGAAPDYILLACKAYDLDSAIEAIAPVAGPATSIVPLLNGLAHLEVLNDRFSPGQVMGGTVSLQVRQTDDGTIEHLNDWQFITVGAQDGAASPQVARLVSALEQARVTAAGSDEIIQKMWEKLVMLATLAGITTLFRSAVGPIASAPGGTELAQRMLALNAQAAANNGHPVPGKQLAQWRDMFADRSSKFAASMLGDMERGGRVEVDHIVGYMLDRVREANLDDTLHAAAFANLKIYEASIAGA